MTFSNRKQKIEYGDFQTPPELTERICYFLNEKGMRPRSILEPTCGEGNFLCSAMDNFQDVEIATGVEVNPEYVRRANQKIIAKSCGDRIQLIPGDFFHLDWHHIISPLPEPLLVIGNLPWVTNSSLGSIGSQNIPQKSNFQNHKGLDALTGKSNFDISEWMLIQILHWFAQTSGFVALLCKTGVARKVLQYACKQDLPILDASLYTIDTKKYFQASVSAGLLICKLGNGTKNYDCSVYDDFGDRQIYLSTFGTRDGKLIANLDCFEQYKHLEGESPYQWRSGIKHDCAKIMELRGRYPNLTNGLGENVKIENDYVFPLLKSSDLANSRTNQISRSAIVTQRRVGEETQSIEEKAPHTWQYLQQHKAWLERRKSSIYKNKPPFSIFGVGEYSFSPWKVAISGLYKQFSFRIVEPMAGKPTMLDDTCYFIACQSKEEAELLSVILNSKIAEQFFQTFIFWDAKRPITVSILSRINICKWLMY